MTPDENGIRIGGGPASEAVQLAVVEASARLKTKEAGTQLFAHFQATNTPTAVKRSIVGALASLNAGQVSEAVRLALDSASLRSAAVPHLDRLDGGDSVGLLSNLVAQAKSPEGIQTAQVALGVLGRIGSEGALPALGEFTRRLHARNWPKALELDLREAVLKTALSNSLAVPRHQPGAQMVLAGYSDCLEGGDATKGRRVFRENPTVQCLRCHQVAGEGGIVGPKLDGVGKRQTRESLLQSVVWPNLQIAAGFETVALTLKDGGTVLGILKSEADGVLTVEVTGDDGIPSPHPVVGTTVVKRERGPSAMPEGLAEQLNPFDLRDLVEYLASLK
jgi:quinoprotein glucose dehydrogenase